MKFEEKVLVWIAISSKGLSKPFIVPSKTAIDQEVYKKECLQPRLIPYIHANHQEGTYKFWPDLASSHYAESVMDFMIENKIDFVEKCENPANLPEVRPIEDFWSILKGKVYENGWEAKNAEELIQKIKN